MWSYSGDPTSNVKDAIRYLVGDVRTEDQLLQDEEIIFLSLRNPHDLYIAASHAAETLAARFARDVDQSIGAFREQASQRMEHFERLAALLRGATGGGANASANYLPVAGGVYDNTTGFLLSPIFTRDF